MNHRSTQLIRRWGAAAAAAGFAWLATACGNVTVGGFTNVAVAVSGDSPDAAPAPQPSVLASGLGPSAVAAAGALPTSHEAEEAEGEVEVDLTLTLVSESGRVVSLGRDDIRIRLDLQGANEAETVDELVPAARYTGLRVTFTHIQVEVSQGLVVDGQPVVGEVHVELEDPELVVARPLDLDATPGGRVELLVDLNTPAWLAAVDPELKTVDASVFAALVDVRMR